MNLKDVSFGAMEELELFVAEEHGAYLGLSVVQPVRDTLFPLGEM